jgi:hypothetical protein
VSLTDPYERKARLAPALLALLPVVALCLGQYGIQPDWSDAGWGLLAAMGVFYVLASIAREYGKRLEPKLYKTWGGVPTTQIQRHQNDELDAVTKARYHLFLAGKLGIAYPSAEVESQDPPGADQIYAAGTRWLLNQTRDRNKFSLLFKENVAYGFRRNALGLKWIALIIAIISLSWTLFSVGALTSTGLSLQAVLDSPSPVKAAITVDLFAIALWTLFITQKTVRTAAFAYADQLLRCCDSIG